MKAIFRIVLILQMLWVAYRKWRHERTKNWAGLLFLVGACLLSFKPIQRPYLTTSDLTVTLHWPPEATVQTLHLNDLTGRTLEYIVSPSGTAHPFNLSQRPRGLYFIQCAVRNGQHYTLRIVKK